VCASEKPRWQSNLSVNRILTEMRRINEVVPREAAAGKHAVRVKCAGVSSEPRLLNVIHTALS
jgi:hypothetical protein